MKSAIQRQHRRREPWATNLPRLDRQVVPGYFRPPVSATLTLRRLAAIALLGALLWVAVVLVTLAVLA